MTENAVEEKVILIKQALDPHHVCILEPTTKREALRAMIDVLADSPSIGDNDELEQAVFRREALMSTGIGLGLAVPHVRLASVRQIVMAVGISRVGIADYASLDDKPVHLIFLIAAREGQHAQHLRLLSAISSRAKAFKESLLACTDAGTFYRMFVSTDTSVGPASGEET